MYFAFDIQYLYIKSLFKNMNYEKISVILLKETRDFAKYKYKKEERINSKILNFIEFMSNCINKKAIKNSINIPNMKEHDLLKFDFSYFLLLRHKQREEYNDYLRIANELLNDAETNFDDHERRIEFYKNIFEELYELAIKQTYDQILLNKINGVLQSYCLKVKEGIKFEYMANIVEFYAKSDA